MITLISNIIKKDNSFLVTTTAVSNTESSSSSSAAGLTADRVEDIQGVLLRTMGISTISTTKVCSDSLDKLLLQKISANPSQEALLVQQRRVASLESELRSKDTTLSRLNTQIENLRREYANYKVEAQRNLEQTVRGLSNGTTATVNVVSQTNGISQPLISTTFMQENTSNVVILNAQLLNNAIKNQEKLESRVCSECGSMIIAPLSVHDNAIICSKCRPQSIDNLELLDRGNLDPVVTPDTQFDAQSYGQSNNNHSTSNIEGDPCADCEGECEGCDHDDSYHGDDCDCDDCCNERDQEDDDN